MSMYYVGAISYSDELYHHGIKGMRWGVRRFVNEDGSLTPEGMARYGTKENFQRYMADKQQSRERLRENRRAGSVSRGVKLLDKNRSRAGEIGRGVGRQIAIGVGVKAGAAAVAFATMKGVYKRPVDSAIKRTAICAAGMSVAAGLGLGLTARNVYKTSRNVVDITRAKNRGHMRKKDRR